MRYMGSKTKLSKSILPVMLRERKPGQTWVEPFVGGGNMIDKVDGPRIGADFNPYVVEALILIRDFPNSIPDIITEEMYRYMRQTKEVDGFTGFTAFAMSFGGKFFGGYRRGKAGTKGCLENMKTQTRQAKQSAIKQSKLIQNVKLVNCSYGDLDIPDMSMVYCDPPYSNTTKYRDSFNHDKFWEWCRGMAKKGHTVFISEYSAPSDFVAIWEKEVNSSLTKDTGAKKATEKLFMWRGF